MRSPGQGCDRAGSGGWLVVVATRARGGGRTGAAVQTRRWGGASAGGPARSGCGWPASSRSLGHHVSCQRAGRVARMMDGTTRDPHAWPPSGGSRELLREVGSTLGVRAASTRTPRAGRPPAGPARELVETRGGAAGVVAGRRAGLCGRRGPGRVPDRAGGAEQQPPGTRTRKGPSGRCTTRRRVTVKVDRRGRADTGTAATAGQRPTGMRERGTALGGSLSAGARRRAGSGGAPAAAAAAPAEPHRVRSA